MIQYISHRNVNTTSNSYFTSPTLHITCLRFTLVMMTQKVVCNISKQLCSHEMSGLICYIAIVLHLPGDMCHSGCGLWIEHVNLWIIFVFIGYSQSYLQHTLSILGCLTISKEYCKLIGLNWKLMRRQLWASTCHIDAIRHFFMYCAYFPCQNLSAKIFPHPAGLF